MRVIDTHQHLWDTSTLSYPWLDGFGALSQKYTIDDYRTASVGIDVAATVHVEANPAPGSEVAEAARLTQLAEEHGLIGAIVASAPLEEPNVAETLSRLTKYPLVVAVRRMAWHRDDPDFYRDPDLIRGVKSLADLDLTFDLCAHADQLPAALDLVRATPDVSHAINHCAGPDVAGRGFDRWAVSVAELAAFPNTVCKISGIVTRAAADWTREDLKPYIDHLVEVFGFERLMFGSDWPVCTLACEYRKWFDALQWAVEDASDADRARLFFGTAAAFYKVTLP